MAFARFPDKKNHIAIVALTTRGQTTPNWCWNLELLVIGFMRIQSTHPHQSATNQKGADHGGWPPLLLGEIYMKQLADPNEMDMGTSMLSFDSSD